MNDSQAPILIFLGVLVVLGMLAAYGYWIGSWEMPP
jgi:hypothetical protein